MNNLADHILGLYNANKPALDSYAGPRTPGMQVTLSNGTTGSFDESGMFRVGVWGDPVLAVAGIKPTVTFAPAAPTLATFLPSVAPRPAAPALATSGASGGLPGLASMSRTHKIWLAIGAVALAAGVIYLARR